MRIRIERIGFLLLNSMRANRSAKMYKTAQDASSMLRLSDLGVITAQKVAFCKGII
jgi:hypothetical protein